MAIFTYHARDLVGVDHNGEIEASDLHSAVVVLRKKGLVVIKVTPHLQNENFISKFFNKVSFGDLVSITRQLATMVGAGLVLSEALDILAEQQTGKKLQKVLSEVSEDIKSGLTLSQALGKHPEVFPQLYVNLVKSGETSGKLDEVLLKMSDSLEKDREFQSRVKGAMIYPAVVISMMGLVMLIMVTFVMPRLTALYKQSSIELPLPTKILIGISDFIAGFWWLIIIFVISAIVGFRRWIHSPSGSLIFDNFILKVPIIGKIITYVTLTNFSRTFGLLISSGIPLLDSINIVADVTQNTSFKLVLKQAYSGVAKGLPFSSLLSSAIFPKLVPQMVHVGEETGKVDEIFYKLADYFESESDHMVKNLTVAIEPIVLVILGVGVGFLVIAVILPIYKLTTSF
ncbi:MAG: type II secretion system F family protein [Candidatus Daviesbacteria bacterium]|nr:type II secretion system F family protein [Candidatus Daviesbacteria bacterium]